MVFKLIKLLGLLGLVSICSIYFTLDYLQPKLTKLSYASGYTAGLENRDWKALAVSEPKVANAVCTQWWFAMNHRQRKLDLTLGNHYAAKR